MKNKSALWGAICVSLGVLLLIVLSLLWGLGIWSFGPAAQNGASDGKAGRMDRHFIEQMIPHHEDAVAMAELALTRAKHPELKELAETIIRDQTREIIQMLNWYRSWYGVDVPADDGVFRGRGMGGRMMQGGMMHDEADMEVLQAASVFDREFIEQMIPHHRMGVMMARMILSRTDRSEIKELSRAIIATQTAEIERMRGWYRSWYE